MQITIRQASPAQADAIARLIMEAMNHDCCRYFAGPQHTLDDFHRLMTRLVERPDSQYSYQNTLVAMAGDTLAGICVSYDGALLHTLRRAFIDGARAAFGIDHGGMDDETQPGELYVDSLAVAERFRGQGIAALLLRATTVKARQLGLPTTGLLVDKGNPRAERLYTRLGFRFVNDTIWGSHPMKHLQRRSEQYD